MCRFLFTLPLFACLIVISSNFVVAQEPEAQCPAWLTHTMPKLHSDEMINLCDVTSGHPVLLVNTASYCGYTKQFGGLESLYQEYKDKGLVVIGFPSDSFNQESDDEAKTASVCYENFGVTFLMTQTIAVKGESAHPIFAHLAKETQTPAWNFNKYLVDSDGVVVEYFPSKTKPMGKKLRSKIDQLL